MFFLTASALPQGFPFGKKPIRRPDTVMVIHAGQLLAVPGEAPLAKQTIVIRNERVEEILPGYVAVAEIDAQGAEVQLLDLSEQFVLPGLMDSHVHLSRATGAYQQGMFSEAPADEGTAAVNTFINTQLTLNAGFTAVRDLGSDTHSLYAIRDAISFGSFVGPTILASGPSIGVTSGHGSAREGAAVCDGADSCRSLTRQLEKAGADLIKIKVTGGFSSNSGYGQHMTLEEIRAIVTAAHMRDISVTAHAYDPNAIIDAVKAGVDCIEHGHQANEAGLKLMKKDGVFLVPTLTIAEPPSFVRGFLAKGEEPISITLRNQARSFEQAYALGVKIAFGTDAGVYPHGRNADEFVTMVDLGMTPADAIRSATVVAAELFSVEGITGTIEPGSRADIIAVVGDPLSNIGVLGDVAYVIKSGRLAKQNGQMLVPLDYSLMHKY
jgi:imidazolonepropionase-like amidohydrolase